MSDSFNRNETEADRMEAAHYRRLKEIHGDDDGARHSMKQADKERKEAAMERQMYHHLGKQMDKEHEQSHWAKVEKRIQKGM